MISILHWKENRDGVYKDGECSHIDELPDNVPGGSVWHVIENDTFWLRHPADRWIDVTEVAIIELPERRL